MIRAADCRKIGHALVRYALFMIIMNRFRVACTLRGAVDGALRWVLVNRVWTANESRILRYREFL